MQLLALCILALSGLWLVAVGAAMALRPAYCLQVLALTASTWRVNVTEQGLRLGAGVAMVVRAPLSKLPLLFDIAGWFIIVSSLVLLVLPLRWHAGYAIWWAARLPMSAVRAVAPLSVGAGLALIWAAV